MTQQGFSIETIVGGTCGTYEFKATYNPDINGDTSTYTGSEATCTVTLSPHVLEATHLQLSISPSTVEHSSASQAAVTSVLDVTLTSASGTHLGNRGVTLYYRLVGSSSWTTVCSLSLDSSGQYYDATGVQY